MNFSLENKMKGALSVDIIRKVTLEGKNLNFPQFKPGDTLKVHTKIIEGGKERIQLFEGIVVGKRGEGISSSFIVRKLSYGVGVERTFPFYSPLIKEIELIKIGKVRRAKLYYLHGKTDKKSRVKTIYVPPEVMAAKRKNRT